MKEVLPAFMKLISVGGRRSGLDKVCGRGSEKNSKIGYVINKLRKGEEWS